MRRSPLPYNSEGRCEFGAEVGQRRRATDVRRVCGGSARICQWAYENTPATLIAGVCRVVPHAFVKHRSRVQIPQVALLFRVGLGRSLGQLAGDAGHEIRRARVVVLLGYPDVVAEPSGDGHG